jgi:hypothetical protein
MPAQAPEAATRRSAYPPAPWHIVYFRRERRNDPTEAVPARTFLLHACPTKVRAELIAILTAVADAPPPAFGGGGKWEAMNGTMSGYFQVKVNGFASGARKHWRLFCLLERGSDVPGMPGPAVVAITGMVKPFLTTFGEEDYEAVRSLGDEFRASLPRSILR